MKKICLFLLVLVSLFMFTGCGEKETLDKYDIEKDIKVSWEEGKEVPSAGELLNKHFAKIKQFDKYSYKQKVKRIFFYEDIVDTTYKSIAKTDVYKNSNGSYTYSEMENEETIEDNKTLHTEYNVYGNSGFEYVYEWNEETNETKKIKIEKISEYTVNIENWFVNTKEHINTILKIGKCGYDKSGNLVFDYYKQINEYRYQKARVVIQDDLVIYFALKEQNNDVINKYEFAYYYGKANVTVPKDLSEYK